MRVLLVGHYPPHRGGVAKHVKALAEHLRERHEVHVLTYGPVKTLEPFVHQVRVPGTFGLRGTSFALLASRKIVRLHERFNFDVVHAHYVGTTSFAGVLAKERTGLPLVVTAHGSDLDHMSELPLGNYFVRRSLLEADAVIAVSHYLAKRAISLGAKGIRVIPNGVDTKGNRERGEAVIFIGRLAKYKGVKDFIELARRFPEEEFWVVGHGPLMGKLKELAPINVRFLGYMDNVATILERAKALVLPSQREGFGLVILEANSFNVPVLGREVGGIKELIREGKNGLTFKDVDEATEALRKLLEPKDNKKMGVTGQRIARKYSWEAICRKVEKVYEEVAGRG
ncbi:glycosyltransferase family 4 protein [Pyrococcus yayanosii]|uniref:Glycosyltransferase n=1 Tax=Pyrococcus yayanosii (strain CH1 / JCM 16557) TaxID=529709 RepID=F8AI35_PYRYC|nr:glycosyltransferase family 4 protein [Pyrococcus yayanosii]AEH25504.1 glycosyltransferase [Pyrococcus yayanosii CH1]